MALARSSSAAAHVSNAIDPSMVVSHKFPEVTFAYDERDVALYALGVGACNVDAADEKELQLVYHRNGQSSIKVLPTFVSLFTVKKGNELGLDVPGLQYDPKLLLHAQQYMEIHRPIPSRANVTNKIKVSRLHDRGKAAVLELETLTTLEGSGQVLCMNRSTIYLRGAGGFSNSSQPFSYATYPATEALMCGLAGYFDPLHSDPVIAQAAGFSHPIPPGLGTLGFVIRVAMRSFSMPIMSERLKPKGSMPIMQWARWNLCRKLGYLDDDVADLTEEALHDYTDLFKRPLPAAAIQALTELFGFQAEYTEMLDRALVNTTRELNLDLEQVAQGAAQVVT